MCNACVKQKGRGVEEALLLGSKSPHCNKLSGVLTIRTVITGRSGKVVILPPL